MTDIAITVTYIMRVTPEWYDPDILSGVGTLEEQICAYEASRVRKDGLYVADLKHEKIVVEFVPELPPACCGDGRRHSKHKFSIKHEHTEQDIWLMCIGEFVAVAQKADESMTQVEEDLMTPGLDNPCQPIGCDNGIHLPGCVFIETDKEESDAT